MPLDFNIDELEQLERDSNQEKLLESLQQFLEVVKAGKTEAEILRAIKENNSKIQYFAEAVKGLKFEQDQSQILNSLAKMAVVLENIETSNYGLIEEIKKLNDTNKATRVFHVKYGAMNRIESIEVKIQ